MKIYSAQQIQQFEQYVIHRGWTSSRALMEEAASLSVDWMAEQFPSDSVFLILAGPGNNGGDGLAICRRLRERGYLARAYAFLFRSEVSAGFREQAEQLEAAFPEALEYIPEGGFMEGLGEKTLVIDALLGLGLNRAPEGWVRELIERVDRLPQRKISLDIPSGLPADRPLDPGAPVIRAQYTLSYHFLKKAFLHEEGARVAGRVIPLPLSFPLPEIEEMPSLYSLMQPADLRRIYRPRDPFSHKGRLGHALLVGGSRGMMGAALLMAWGGLRSGVGKLSLRLPRIGYAILQSQAPEALCSIGGEDCLEDFGDPEGWQAIGLGPGMGTDPRTEAAMDRWLDRVQTPLVLDADALNILARHPGWLHRLPAESILCPHPAEFDRLFGSSGHSMERMELARHQAMKYNLHLLVKGHYSQLAGPEGSLTYVYQDEAGLATAGSGDVLTGLITGLCAQGYPPAEALALGTYIHGRAGAIAARALGEESMKAGDIPIFMGQVFASLREGHPRGPGIDLEDQRNS